MGLHRLSATVKRQRDLLSPLFNDPERDQKSFHLEMADALRSMLVENEIPTLIELSKHRAIQLFVWAPFHPDEINQPAPIALLRPLTASYTRVSDAYKLTIQDYMNAPIGAVTAPLNDGQSFEARWRAPKSEILQITRWAIFASDEVLSEGSG